MRIDCTYNEGITGIEDNISIDTKDLPLKEAKKVRMMVKDADFFNLPVDMTEGAPDLPYYEVEIHSAGRRHKIRVDDLNVPKKLKPLLSWLREKLEGRKAPMAMR